MFKNYFRKWNLSLTKPQIACVAAGVFLYALVEITSVMGGGSDGKGLKRAGPGRGETTYEIEVSGLYKENTDKKIPVKIPVGERLYSDDEANKLFETLKPQLEKQILGENESLLEIRKNLNLKSSLDDFGFKIRWETDNPDLVSSLGKVDNQKAAASGEAVILKARLTDGSHEHTYSFPIMVYPPASSLKEKTGDEFLTWALEEDQKQQTKDYLQLPDEYEGQLLTYTFQKDNSHRLFPFLGLFMALLLYLKVNTDKQQLAKKREQQLLLDYSEVVSKLVVYIGAGITVRGSWERIVAGYDAGVREGKRSVRPVYEEMMKTASQLGSGVSESKAFGEFGRRCGLQSYLKLSALLEQSQKNGSKQLRQSLELEMISAFEQRKNLAKRLGEEAGTKLLIPLFLMLAVVMAVIVVPAFLSFF
ncbi:immunoglobulin-like domain-containing protein [Lacrimispora aerotolerans]|uniref:immunoglobulin-like domain-containing protein n=1 Tax=Lacrimispora aerotolerans TaxID=36832 RepID=UPI000478D29E|nr:immunoglobulin-like domain-containing protein [Lacrimispora aerotolerans]